MTELTGRKTTKYLTEGKVPCKVVKFDHFIRPSNKIQLVIGQI